MHALIRLLGAASLALAVALLASCGGSGKGLIPAAQAGPLQSDFEEVAHAAEAANGKCAATEAALAKTETDFTALPSSVDRGLRSHLEQGISNLRARALAMCAQPAPTATTTNPSTATTPATTPTQESTTPTTTQPATPPGEGGGTAAPGEGEGEAHGKAKGEGKGEGKGKDEGKTEGGGEAEGAEGASAGGGASGGASAGGASPEGGK